MTIKNLMYEKVSASLRGAFIDSEADRIQHASLVMNGQTVSDFYLQAIGRNAERIAIGSSTWADLDRRRLVVTSGLMHMVLHPKRRVVIALAPGEEHALAHLAVWSAGALPIVVEPEAAKLDIARIARETEATHAIVESSAIAQALGEIRDVRAIVVLERDLPRDPRM